VLIRPLPQNIKAKFPKLLVVCHVTIDIHSANRTDDADHSDAVIEGSGSYDILTLKWGGVCAGSFVAAGAFVRIILLPEILGISDATTKLNELPFGKPAILVETKTIPTHDSPNLLIGIDDVEQSAGFVLPTEHRTHSVL